MKAPPTLDETQKKWSCVDKFEFCEVFELPRGGTEEQQCLHSDISCDQLIKDVNRPLFSQILNFSEGRKIFSRLSSRGREFKTTSFSLRLE